MEDRLRGIVTFGLTACVLFLHAPSTRAATLVVPGNYATIQAAINAASGGDVILVSPGEYSENLDYLGKAIAIRSVSGPVVSTINVASGTAVKMGSDSELSGFTVSGASAEFGAGIAVTGNNQLIENNIFQSDQGFPGGFGAAIGGNGASPIVEDNIFRDNNGAGGIVSFVNTSSPVIVNNVFENNSGSAITVGTPLGASPKVINNTIVGNSVGVEVDNQTDSSAAIFRNNIIANNEIGLEDDFGSGRLPPTWQNNLLYNNPTEYSGISDLTGTMGNLLGNPLFVSSTDFHLTLSSPAIANGSALLAPPVDFDGTPRPANSIDIGAYQLSVPEPSSTGLLFFISMSWLGRRKRRNSCLGNGAV
jgi:Right handed beta helix region